MNAEDYTEGQPVDYRAVVSVPCDPIRGSVVERRGELLLIDCGATRYAAPYDRDRRWVRAYQLTAV